MGTNLNSFGIGKAVSLFTLGTMRAIKSQAQMQNVLEEAYLIGINHIETAPVYGLAEKLLGKSIKALRNQGIEPKNGWVITSKILPGLSVEEGKQTIINILTSLKQPYIDNLAIHGMNQLEHLNWVLDGEGAKLIEWVKREGLVKQIGFSSHGSDKVIQMGIDSKQFGFCSLHLHLLDPHKMPLATMALKNGMGVMAISPADKGGHLHSPSQTLSSDCFPFLPLELAYRFLLSHGITTLTVGAESREDLYLASKYINSNQPLSTEELQSISHMKRQEKNRLGDTFCGQCRECLPCPHEVPIPSLLRLRNLYFGYNLQSYAKERYNLIGMAGHWWETINANACQSCGHCLPKCPHKLNIPTLLAETHATLKDKPTRRLWD